MNQPAWERLVDLIDLKFGIKSHGTETRALEDRTDLSQTINFIQFDKDDRHYRLERISSPAVIDRKTHYHRTAGSQVRFENIYDTEQISHKTQLYIDNQGEWEPIELSDLAVQ